MKLDDKALEQLLLCAEDFYIIDDTTQELLYVSDSISAGDTYAYVGCKCYEALHGLSERCTQCPATELCIDSQQAGAPYYRWDRFDAECNIWYQVRHRVARLDGRFCRIANCNVVEGMMQLGSTAIKEMGSLMNLLEENRKIKRQLEYDNTHDQMTALYNRNRYTQDLVRLASMESMGVVYVDINNLKETNDRHGHTEGDGLICTTSRCLRAAAPKDARCYRIGGDEFVALLPNRTAAEVDECRCAFLAALDTENNNKAIPCLAACGIAYGNSAYDMAALVSEAEAKMYIHKGRKNKKKTAYSDCAAVPKVSKS
ncbi:MAG: GGDEF domain-containing protein [Oscillospiraceae bacterium]